LIKAIDKFSLNSNTLDAYFAAVDTIKSDYERGRVLKAILKANPANKEILMATIASAAKISSDY
jgi:tRNA U54 and U55 pseudouridine synthase Pus10